ncbi:SigE family RNA polymerase sigma factor [Streptacidiphilus albus]|uniref:SigE family RNA polymerase sigma factor n=1 Tax=Streptacidiphilus albus TaxID=105425 RepID=UPI00054C4BF2|nr:SigE family RNA polymerase sigma factor [Streptacidiphilus albus]
MKEDDGELHAFIEGGRDRLFRSAFLLCGDRHEADDLVQSTLLKVVMAWRRLERIDNVEAYTRRTLMSVFIASRRRMWRRETPHADLPERPARVAGAPDPGSELTQAVLTALAGLPVKQRAVLVLRYWEDLTVEATAEALNMRPGTVRSHASRGIATMRSAVPLAAAHLQKEDA